MAKFGITGSMQMDDEVKKRRRRFKKTVKKGGRGNMIFLFMKKGGERSENEGGHGPTRWKEINV